MINRAWKEKRTEKVAQLKDTWQLYLEGALNSYAQIFYSNARWFAIVLVFASFIDPYAGISGLFSVLVTQFFALWLGFGGANVRNGVYGFNSVMVGLSLGVYFQPSVAFFVILALMSFFTLLLTIVLGTINLKYKIPFLSLPFLISVWTVLLMARSYDALGLSERGIYTINELYGWGGIVLVNIFEAVNNLDIPIVIDVYLKSLGAIFFQYNLIAGVLICLGIIIYSRIAFSLSLVGYFTGYLFYYFLEGDFTQLHYSYIGFNFILTAIAIGGFFTVPSRKSYLLVVLVTPLIAILISATAYVFAYFQLPIYSLPFNIVVLIMLFVLNLRLYPKGLDMVVFQQFSPEKNLYKHVNNRERFANDTYVHVALPFYGDWFISQGHEGDITHKEDWKYAWDFVVTDERGSTFREPGTDVSHYFCYNLPVLAPAAGTVETIQDEIEDNPIGDVNLEENWGNTIIIKHSEYLYSKLSHIKKGSFKVKQGDYVKKGDVIASCGSSGRSPEPHLHFQLQSTPYVGSKTLKYPVSYYIFKQKEGFEFRSFDYPEENETISNVATTSLIKEAFYFIPGNVLRFKVGDDRVKWEVFTDAYNYTYIYCHNTKSYAYFVNNGTLIYFTDFTGDQKSLLYYFYIGAHKILLGFYQDIELDDKLPIAGFYNGPAKFLQDFIAPFHIFLKTHYKARYAEIDDDLNPEHIVIKTSAEAKIGNIQRRKLDFTIELKNQRIERFVINENGKETIAEWLET